MSRRSSVSAVRAVSCPAECDQFRLASCKAPRPSGAPLPPRIYARERLRKRESESSRSLALRFFHPFFLSPPFSLSFIERLPLGPLRSSCSCLFFFLSRSLPLAFSTVLSLTSLSSVSLIFLLSLGGGASSFSVVLVFRVVLFLFFRPLILPRVALFPSEFTPERVFLPLSRRLHLPYPLLLFPRPFLSLSIAVFCTLRI